MARKRESELWGQVIDDVGVPADGVEYVCACDRGADSFEVFVHLKQQKSQWVIRARDLNRHLTTMDDQTMPLSEFLDYMELRGTYELHLRARPNQPARVAKIEVSCGRVFMPLPKHKSPWLKSQSPDPIAMNVVRVREVDAPDDVEAIEWILYTSLPVETFAPAWLDHHLARLGKAQYSGAGRGIGSPIQEDEMWVRTRREADGVCSKCVYG